MSGLSCPRLVNIFAAVLCFLVCSFLWQEVSSKLTLTQETGKGRLARLGDEVVYKCTASSSAVLRWVVDPLIPKHDPLLFWPHERTQEPEKTRGNFRATLIESIEASDSSYNMTSLLTITVAPESRKLRIQCRSTLDFGETDAADEVVIGFDSKALTISESQNAIAVLRVINGSVPPGESKAVEVTGWSDTALGNGIDFDFTQADYTFTDTQTVHFVSVTIVEDFINEQMESFQLLASSSNAGVIINPDRIDIRIINREPKPKDINKCGTNNGGCSQICTDTEGSFRYSCRRGYALDRDGKSCNNINECDTSNGGCSHICTDTEGSFRCSCKNGYTLASDGRSCNDVNESDTNNDCYSHISTDTEGSFRCSCRRGYSIARDEKSNISNGGCSRHCTDTEGLLICNCTHGYADGRNYNSKDESMTTLAMVVIVLGAAVIGIIIIARGQTPKSTTVVTWTKFANIIIEMNNWNIIEVGILAIVLGPSIIGIVSEREACMWTMMNLVLTLIAAAVLMWMRGSPPTPPAKPDQLIVDDIQTDRACIWWVLTHSTPEEAADQFILVISRRHDDEKIMSRTVTLPGTATSHTVEGLSPGLHYKVTLTAQNSAGEESVGPKEFSTIKPPPPLPHRPDGLTVDDIQTDCVHILWDSTDNTCTLEEAAEQLILVISRRCDNVTVKSYTMTLPGTATSHTVDGLTPGVNYKATLTAQNSFGEVTVGPVEFSTKSPPSPSSPSLPDKHYRLRVDDIRTDQACVSWDHSTPEEDLLTLVVNRCNEVEKHTLPKMATSHTLTDLTPGDHYQVTLIAENLAKDQTDGEGYIEQVQFSTLSISKCLLATSFSHCIFHLLDLLSPYKEVSCTVNWKHRVFVFPEEGIAVSLNFDSRLSGLLQFANIYNFKVTIRAYLPNSQQYFSQNSDTASVLYKVVIHNPENMPGKYTPGGRPTLEAKVLHCSAVRSAYFVFEDAEAGASFPTDLKKHSQSNIYKIEDKEARMLLESPCSWFALVGNQNSHRCEFSAQFFVCPDGPQKFYIFFIVTKNLPLLLNALTDMFSEQYSASKVMELPVSFNAERVSLIVPEEGIETNGWHIAYPQGPLEILKASATLMPTLEGTPVIRLTATYENGEDVQPFHYQFQLSGLTSVLRGDPFFIHYNPTGPNSTIKPSCVSDHDERRRPTLKSLKESGLLQDLSPYWPLVAISLGLGGSICRIRAMYPGNSPKAKNTDELCTLEVIARWLREAREPTWGKMTELIDKCNQYETRNNIATILDTIQSKTVNLIAPPVNTTAEPTAVIMADTDLERLEGTVCGKDLDWQLLAVSLGMGHYINHEQDLAQPHPCYSSSNITQLLQLWCRDKGDSATWKELCLALRIYGTDF